MLKTLWLPAEDYHVLDRYFAEFGVPTPDPSLSSVAVAVTEEGELAGFIALQTVIHSEPIYINPEFRGTDVWRALVEKVQEPFKDKPGSGFYVFIPKDRPDILHMAKETGLEVLDWMVAKKEF